MTPIPFRIHGHKLREGEVDDYNVVMQDGCSMLTSSICFPEWFPLVIPKQLEWCFCPFCGHPAVRGGLEVKLLVLETFSETCTVKHASHCSCCGVKTFGSQSIKRVEDGSILFKFKDAEGAWRITMLKLKQRRLYKLALCLALAISAVKRFITNKKGN